MAGGQRVRAQPVRKVLQRAELDLAVAQNVRVWRAPPAVLRKEVLEHPIHVFLLEVDGVVGDANPIAYGAHVRPVRFGGADAHVVLLGPVVHEYADDLVALAL